MTVLELIKFCQERNLTLKAWPDKGYGAYIIELRTNPTWHTEQIYKIQFLVENVFTEDELEAFLEQAAWKLRYATGDSQNLQSL